MFETHQKTWFGQRGLGRPVLGSAETIGAATPARVRKYFASHYHPKGLIFALAGHLPPKTFSQAAGLIKEWQGPGNGSGAGDRPVVDSPPPRSFPLHLYHRPNLGASYLTLTLPIPGYTHPGRFPAMMLSRALGADSSSRLFVEVREKRGLCYDVGATAVFYKNQGYFEVYATTGHPNLTQVLCLCVDQLKKLAAKGLKEDERNRVAQQVRGGFLMSQEGTPNTMNRLASNQYVFGKPWTEKDFMATLKKQTAHRLNDFAAEYLANPDFSISLLTSTAQAQAVAKSLKTHGFAPAQVLPLEA